MGTMGLLLRANATYLVTTATIAFVMGALGVPMAGVGFVDAHELALIAGLLLWSATPRRCWHLAAAALHLLFAAANVAHWQTFVSAEIIGAGYLTTFMHLLFAALQCLAAHAATASSRPLAAAAEAAW